MIARHYNPEYLDEILPPLPVEEGESGKPHHEPDEIAKETPVVLNEYGRKAWCGEIAVHKDDGEVDRSKSLMNLARVLYDSGATRRTTVEALKERDAALGWEKYTDRKDDAQYHDIVDELESNGRNNVYPLDSQSKGPTPGRSSFKDRIPLHRLIADGVEEPKELVAGVLLEGGEHHLYADAGSGKSWVALGLSKEILEQGRSVVYVDKENGKRTMAERIKSIGVPLDKIEEHFYYFESPTSTLEEAARRDFEEMLEEVEPVLVIFDAWIGFLTDADLNENESRDIQRWASVYLHPARQRGITTLILDHVPHEARRSRGSGRKKEEVDVQWELSRSEDFDRGKVGRIRLLRKKDREGWLPNKVTFRLGGAGGEFIFEREQTEKEGDDLSDAQRKVLKILEEKFEGGATNAEWMNACKEYENMSESTHYDARKKLIEGRVEKRSDEKFHPDYGSDDWDWGW